MVDVRDQITVISFSHFVLSMANNLNKIVTRIQVGFDLDSELQGFTLFKALDSIHSRGGAAINLRKYNFIKNKNKGKRGRMA